MKIHKPKFDSEGYQVDMEDINGESLPDFSKVQIARRRRAGVPAVSEVRVALEDLKENQTGKSLIEARKKLGFTQERFAKVLDVKVGTYRQWEQGRRSLKGPARALVRIVSKHPNLVSELEEPISRKEPKYEGTHIKSMK